MKGVFLGHYFRWDPRETYEVARKHGFSPDSKPRTGFYEFADVDDDFLITIHHWMKWYKFGFTRLWDNLSIEIRNGRITREQAIAIVREAGEELPKQEIDRFCSYTDISERRFFEIVESFRNKDIWERQLDGTWQLNGFLIDGWSWAK